jgi:c(7)-type cytochrome triheme protein
MKHCIVKQFIAICVILCFVKTTYGVGTVSKVNPYWLTLVQDRLHDPNDPALHLLQDPAKVLSPLPSDESGNQVDWVKALEKGYISPNIRLRSNIQDEVLDLNILFPNTGEMGMVDFPHKQHTEWLICSNCHEEIFKYKARATKFGMFDILNGEYCGRCHGAVAFPLTDCKRCHNLPRGSTAAARARTN